MYNIVLINSLYLGNNLQIVILFFLKIFFLIEFNNIKQMDNKNNLIINILLITS